jgi:hypothetical protein
MTDGRSNLQPAQRRKVLRSEGSTMKTKARDEEELQHRGVWRQLVFDRARELEVIRKDLQASAPAGRDPCGLEDGGCVDDLLAKARAAAKRPQTPLVWWSGSLIERAWLALHQAEYHLVRHMQPAGAAAWWQQATGNRPGQHTPWATGSTELQDEDTRSIALSLRAHHNASDRSYEQIRAFRNRLLVYALLGAVLVALLLGAAARLGWNIPGPDGEVVGGLGQFGLVALFGAVGAYVVGLPSVLSAKVRRSPYQLTSYQLALKLVIGPLFALLGVLLVQAGLVVQMEAFASFGPALLVWAAIFGGAQQLVTGFLDRKATDVLGDDSAKEADDPIERVA